MGQLMMSRDDLSGDERYGEYSGDDTSPEVSDSSQSSLSIRHVRVPGSSPIPLFRYTACSIFVLYESPISTHVCARL
jgi:hypothetical protein